MFVARQLLEKSIKHTSQLYVLFVDHRKAYDSIPHHALWLVLERVGVPQHMLGLIHSLNNGMEARVCVAGGLTDAISVANGLRQSCTLAPTLFDIYFATVVASWRSRLTVPGVTLRYRIGRKLVGDRSAKSKLLETEITKSQFANDAALYAPSQCGVDILAREFVSCTARWGLTVSTSKTKVMAVGDDYARCGIHLESGDVIDQMASFTYLGGSLDDNGSLDGEVAVQLAKASLVFGSLQMPISHYKPLSIRTKRLVYTASVHTALFYGAES